MSLHDTTLTPTQKWILNTNHSLLRSLRHPALQQLGQRCLDGVLHDAGPLGGLNTGQRSGDEDVVAGGVFRSSSSQRQSAVGVNKSMNPWQWLALVLASGVAAGGG